ncbi:recombination-associated protein RdgC [Gayadomonas joobiniege]|uniref:recombination-associated protein RdgC n=1 Tax=Gayadomonas joobiniege TaxID=1234606 RepID=UPI00037494B5|nr:recombination-associated protein RdgC [Gayadomonas joobiniege]
MWFKNALMYRFTQTPEFSPESLEQQLQEFSFKPCANTEVQSIGWAPALSPKTEALVHASGQAYLINLKKQEKVLPAAVVKELLDEKIELIQEQEDRKVKGKEKQTMKEELIHTLLPQAFSKSSFLRALIVPQAGWIFVESASHNKAEELLAHLRKTLSSLPVVPPESEVGIPVILTDWMRGQHPTDFVLGAEVELKDFADDEGVLRCKNLALDSDDLQNHLDNGKMVTRLAVEWKETLSCLIGEDASIKRIQFSDVIKEQNEDITDEDKLARLDADFTLMAGELTAFAERLSEVLQFTAAEE